MILNSSKIRLTNKTKCLVVKMRCFPFCSQIKKPIINLVGFATKKFFVIVFKFGRYNTFTNVQNIILMYQTLQVI